MMKTVIVALVASTATLAVSVSAGGGAHNRCGSTWETCAQRGKASPVAVQRPQQPTQQYQQQNCDPKKGGCR